MNFAQFTRFVCSTSWIFPFNSPISRRLRIAWFSLKRVNALFHAPFIIMGCAKFYLLRLLFFLVRHLSVGSVYIHLWHWHATKVRWKKKWSGENLIILLLAVSFLFVFNLTFASVFVIITLMAHPFSRVTIISVVINAFFYSSVFIVD